ncbi:HNH endonuclease [Rhodopirellula bahusiensis]|uniref:HNH endonuclease n=2 Tax=Rhodopirellula bahusiensis TaxID=2014065 RepID=UPI0032670F98
MPVVEFRLHRAYKSASLIRNSVEAEYGLDELDWTNDNVLGCLAKYSKDTLLHYYIWATIAVQERRYFRKCIDDDDQIDDACDQLRAYDIEFSPFARSDDDEGDEYFLWFLQNEEAFESLWGTLTYEVFQLLFRDRSFLLQFNRIVAEHLQAGNVAIPDTFIANNGFLKRDGYFPAWLKRAIFHRDQGLCVLCQKDLSSLFHTESQVHFDHMVPLPSWGFNDPCNLQLLCQHCNLSKSGTTSVTSAKYVPFWNE